MDSSEKHVNTSPEEKAGCLSKLFYCWFLPFFKLGYRKNVELKDVYNSANVDLSGPLGDALERNWKKELHKYYSNKKQKPSLEAAIFQTFWRPFSFSGVALFFQYVIIRSLQPLVLTKFINFFDTHEKIYSGWIWGSGVVLLAFVNVVINHSTNLATQRVGMRVRTAACSLIYRKLLKLNHCSLGETAAGQLVNLLSNDVQRFDLASVYLHTIWIMPISAAVTFYILYIYVGFIAAATGMFVLSLEAIPLQGTFCRWQGKLRYKIALKTDKRIKLMSEITSGIQVIKMYAWEKPFEKVVELARKLEIDVITTTSQLYGFLSAMSVFTERLLLYITLLAFVLVGQRLSGDVVFSLAQLFNNIQHIMAISFPKALSYYFEAKVSIKRLEEFLLLEENKKLETTTESGISIQPGGIVMTKVTASWESTPIVPTLTDINLQIKPGILCCVVGNVGSGKSSLLHLLLQEMPKKGEMQISGKVSYASQEPWLFSSSVKDNIVFGRPFIRKRYQDVIRVCSLTKDLKQLPYGDKTLVGERGASLSGGQRARINLARAVYEEADIYLFDDPLSAVDTKVGKQLFDDCLTKYLNGKTRILVTHQLQFMRKSDLIVIISNGKVEKVAKFYELSEYEINSLHEDPTVDDNEKEKIPENPEIYLRRMSTAANFQSVTSIASSMYFDDQKETSEFIEKGSMPSSMYLEYLRAGAGIAFLLFMCFEFLVAQIITNASDLWLTHWTNIETRRFTLNSSTYKSQAELHELGEMEGQEYYIWIYSALILSSVILLILRSVLFYQVCMSASKSLHNRMFNNILQAPMRFFDTNPSGRILNRFSKDMGAIDELLPRCSIDAIQILMVMVGILFMVFIVIPWMIIPAVMLAPMYYYLRVIYLKSAQGLKRLEGLTKAPVFSHISASLYGITTIRASNAEKLITKEFDTLQDQHTSTWFSFLVSSTAFGFYLDLLSCTFVAIVAMQFLIFDKDYTVSGNIGLVISSSIILTGMVQAGVRQSAEITSNMISVERVLQYTKLDKEGPFESLPTKKPPQDWPKNGKINFTDVYLRYAPDLPPVLKGLNIQVNSGEKIGIVGRTGAGKSTLIASLFRLAPVDGKITIDEIYTAETGLYDLRTNISIIPQEPVLFSASLRYNLDPFEKHSDDVLWKALENVELKDAITELNQAVSEGGGNFSAGQRQLICLARAIVRNNKILVMDEATANVDPKTDALIQKTIRERFKSCTVLTIAHRLNTIMDSDKVLVMEAGQAVEYDHPFKLLQNTVGHFSKMVAETGPSLEGILKSIAKTDYYKKTASDTLSD